MNTTIGDLFDIKWGQKEYHSKEHLIGLEGNTILISSKGEDGGIYGFFDIPVKYKAPFITVPSTGTIGQAYVQRYDCCVNDDVLILQPKKVISFDELYSIAYQIRQTKWKYNYGRKVTPERLKSQKVAIYPQKKDWLLFEKEITPKQSEKSISSENKNMVWKKIKDICNINRNYYLYINQINTTVQRTPYITTTERDNGVGVFCEDDPIAKAKQLTVALDGTCGESFYQLKDFISGEKTAVLNHDNKYFLIYIGACIKLLSWNFHYGRKLSMEKLHEMKIPIPYKNGQVDFEYIKNLVENSYGYSNIMKYL